MKGDSIYLYHSNRLISLNLKNMVSVSFEYERKGGFGTVTGALSGMYLGSLLTLTSRDNSGKFLEYDETSELVIYELLFSQLLHSFKYI